MKITVETTVKATLEAVWTAYTNPTDIMQWNAASADWHTTRAEMDLRVGGLFLTRMEAKDGSLGFDFAGVYTKIIPLQVIEYQFGDRTCRVDFMPHAGKVIVRITFDAETDNPVAMQQQGWQAILDNFAKHVERLKWS